MYKSYVVGVTGGSGSGKTSFVRELREQLGDQATFFSQDDYYVDTNSIELDGAGVHNFDLPQSIDSTSMAADILRVLAGDTVYRKEYTFQTIYAEGFAEAENTGVHGKMRAFPPASVIIIEGLFCLHEPALKELMDLQVYIDASDVAKLTRRIKRDRIDRLLPLEDVLYRYEKHVLPAYEKYIAPYKRTADIIINNEYSYGQALNVLVQFLKAQLR